MAYFRSVAQGAVGVVSAMLLSATMLAQAAARNSGPVSGTWAGEVSTGGLGLNGDQSAALLRFISPQAALVGAFAFSRIGSSSSGGGGGPNTYTSTALQVGARRYARTGLGMRPVYGGGLLLRTSNFSLGSSNSTTSVGAYGEAGAAWFFNPHISLGVLGGISAVRGDGNWSIGGSLARLTAAVYF